MPYRFVELGVLVKTQPKEASARIVRAFGQARGEEEGAARLLGVSARSLRRWVVQLGLKESVARMWRIEQERRRRKKQTEEAR